MKKQEKKFVLAGLALLAITGLLALAGCKNDTVPEPTRYTVSFDKGDNSEYTGDLPADITVVSGTKLTAEQLEGLDDTAGYIFEGWYDGETKAEGGTYTVTKDTTLYAVWTDNGTVATVTFSPPTGTKFYCDESIAVSLTSEEGATIQYKLGDQNWQDYTADTTIPITGDTTITAKATKEGLKPSETTATYTVRKLEGITVTSPTRTVYSERQSFDPTGMVVTATYDDKSQREVTGWETDFNTVAGEKGLNKPVTVSYTEGETPKTTTFTVTVFPAEVKVLTGYTSPNNTDDSWTYVEFGKWPQSEASGVSPTLVASQPENLFKDKYYSDANGEYVEEGGKYYKVEPIVWRVLTESYNSTKHALLLAESILTGGIKWADSKNDYMESNIRKWLNGNSGTGENSDYSGTPGFLQTAFTADAQSLIADTTVDNSAASTNPASNPKQWAEGENPYASDTPTRDKVFLLSEKEATTESYGFATYIDYGEGNTRIRVTTDYAKATGVEQHSTPGYGGWWWLRSPDYGGINESIARCIYYD
ncbi:MAG: InlB B-repeat-containing protein, partial [Clostridia bacterium]|nr:InlB B-repeat-containing protein [Clostridia bacterium]